MKTIYCFNNGGQVGLLHAVAICEDGHVLGQHACSSEYFMKHDLGITSDWKHDNYNAHCGEGNWKLEWVDKPKKHAGLMEAFRLNQEMAANPSATPAPEPATESEAPSALQSPERD